jgi:hypothetical protein
MKNEKAEEREERTEDEIRRERGDNRQQVPFVYILNYIETKGKSGRLQISNTIKRARPLPAALRNAIGRPELRRQPRIKRKCRLQK